MTVTSLFRKKGEQFFTSNGVPLSGGKLYYYQASTTTQAVTYLDSGATTPNSFPLVLDASGRLNEPVYITDAYNLKELLTDSAGNTIGPWPFDNIPKTPAAAPLTGFERLYQPWVLINSGNTPYYVTGAQAGTAFECDCTSGDIIVYLPTVASTQNGTGFTFKKTDTTNRTLAIFPRSGELVDGLTHQIVISVSNMTFGITNDGSQWLSTLFSALPYFYSAQTQPVTTSSSSLSIDMSLGWNVALSLNNTITSFTVSNWPATGTLGKLSLDITNGGSNAINAWPASTKWMAGIPPLITTGAGKLDTVVLTSFDGGTTFRGYVSGQDMY
jgi:hypothetical protein